MRLDGFGLIVRDMGAMVRFYRDVLGFEVRECEDTGFDKMLKEPFQMGANATVGYGLSVMQKVKAGGNQA